MRANRRNPLALAKLNTQLPRLIYPIVYIVYIHRVPVSRLVYVRCARPMFNLCTWRTRCIVYNV